jgi:hypothetical protein
LDNVTDFSFSLGPFQINWIVSFKTSLEKEVNRIGGIDKVTNELAIKILKRIKRNFKRKAFFSKPVVVFTIGVILVLSFIPTIFLLMLSIKTLPIFILGAMAFIIGGSLIGIVIRNLYNGWLSDLKAKYEDISKEANEAIKEVEKHGDDNKAVKTLFEQYIKGNI